MMRSTSYVVAVSLTLTLGACGGAVEEGVPAEEVERTAMIEAWDAGHPAFGVFVPNEREPGATGPNGERLPPLYTSAGGAALGANPLLDYLFLNLEGAYDPAAVTEMAAGLATQTTGSRKTLLVRIPPISTDGAEVARARVAESLAAGADGIVLPHVRSAEEARLAVSFFTDVGADVWTPENPDGTVVAMLMVEDPGALAEVAEIADTPGYSILACGIGSLTAALGDRAAAEAGNIEVLRHAQRVGRPDMITANANDVEQRIEEGFLALLMNGPEADAHIEAGRAAAGR